MAQTFHENFRQKGSDQEKYNEGWERVFGKKKCTCKEDVTKRGMGLLHKCDYCKEMEKENGTDTSNTL